MGQHLLSHHGEDLNYSFSESCSRKAASDSSSANVPADSASEENELASAGTSAGASGN
jgi:hypothetical protein